MAYYKDFSKYQLLQQYQLDGKETRMENVLNIGWLGESGSFEQGYVSKEFLLNLWEYYKCPVFKTRKIYNNQSLDGYWKFFTAIFNGRTTQLGRAEIRVVDKENGVIYAAPELIIHYIVNHNYLPPKEFIDAVLMGPKPNSEEFCKMIQKTYEGVRKLECTKTVCPYCNSKYVGYAYCEKNDYSISEELIVVDTDIVPKESIDNSKYTYYQMCKNCGRLSEFEY